MRKISSINSDNQKAKKKKEQSQSEIKKQKEIDKSKDDLYSIFKQNVIDSIDKSVDNKIKEKDETGKKYTKRKIANDLNIDYQTLLNYTTDRVPELRQLLYIKKYFDIPYTTFFKGINGNADDNNNSTINNSLLLGLDIETQQVLTKLVKNSNSDDDLNSINQTKLLLINAIIKDENLFNRLADYFSISLGRNILDNKHSNNKFYKPFKNDESAYSMTKYAIMTDFIKYIDSLVNGENVPRDIKSKAEKYAYTYSGKIKPILDEYYKDK